MCIDDQKLNKATQKDHFPLPFIDEMLERLANHSFCYLEWHDKRIKAKQFKSWGNVLLFNSRVRLFGHGELCCKWEGPYIVLHAADHDAVTLKHDDGDTFKHNGQCLKLFLESNPQDFEEVDVLDFLEL
jgi:hypothetical protein